MMKRRPAQGRLALAALLLVAFAAPTLGQSCDALGFRIWRPGGEQIRYAYGDVIRLEPGIEAHLYVHHASPGRFPYSTGSVIGHPHDVGMRVSYDPKVLKLRPQNEKDRREGRLIFNTARPGRTNLGYRIESVSQAGVFRALPPGCRRGVVVVEVVGPDPDRGGPNGEARRAARELGHELEKALIPWQTATIDDDELRRILSGGREGLIRHALAILRSETFQQESYYAMIDRDPGLRAEAERYGDVEPERVADVLLGGVYGDLYGGSRPGARLHKANVLDLLACVSGGERARSNRCEQLAERLIASPVYTQLHRQGLDALEASRGR